MFGFALPALALLGSAGCGFFVTDAGVFPLPAAHVVSPYPVQFGVAYEEVVMTSANGQPIYGWFIPAEGAAGTVLMHHGALGNRSVYPDFYLTFHRLGYHVFIYDYQGFGESLVPASLGTVLDDANAALDYLRTRPEPGCRKVVAHGVSMGTLPALAQAAGNPPEIIGVVLEGVVNRSLHPLAYLAIGISPSPEAFTRIPPELDPYTNAQRIAAPKLFLQSREDFLTFFDGSRELFDIAAAPKEFVEVRGPHIVAVTNDPAYPEIVGRFLAAVTADRPP